MDIAILGGGVAGLASALALARRDMNPGSTSAARRRHDGGGRDVMAERRLRAGGAGILDEVLELGGTPAAMPLRRRGQSLGGLDIGPLDRLMGYPTCAILRTDLQAVLLRRARGGVPVAFGREATAIANDPDGRAVVHFADGGR